MTFCSLTSGSSGNATYIATNTTRVLVDAGVPGRTLSNKLAQIDILPETIDAILITHEHADHITGAGVLSRKHHIPIYANEATWQTPAMRRLVGEVPVGLRRIFESGAEFYIGDLGVLPIIIPHDTVEPVAFRLYAGNRSVAVATDMGRVPKKVLKALASTDLVLLESNHDPDMLLHNTRYPDYLKKRILGAHGHLSNLTCAQTLAALFETGVNRALLGHLSADNNTPELALQTVSQELRQKGLKPGVDIHLDMTWRDRIGGLYTLD
ncbi:MAG: MBL fold metallo-hydrolase [Clostridiales bacterium]|nr:MBL fold metallo-hydrolase [Clostridiales bacterium]